MSADNYYEVRKHPNGGFTYIMGFDSNPYDPIVSENDPQFDEVWDAWNAAQDDLVTEYGVSFHPEVYADMQAAIAPKR